MIALRFFYNAGFKVACLLGAVVLLALAVIVRRLGVTEPVG